MSGTWLFLTLAQGLVLMLAVVAARAYARRSKQTHEVLGIADKESERQFLVDNWSMVEQVAARHGMSPEELGEVRRRVFDSSD
jgi:hypothetical protein